MYDFKFLQFHTYPCFAYFGSETKICASRSQRSRSRRSLYSSVWCSQIGNEKCGQCRTNSGKNKKKFWYMTLKLAFQGHEMSEVILPLERTYTCLYMSVIQTLSLMQTIFKILSILWFFNFDLWRSEILTDQAHF